MASVIVIACCVTVSVYIAGILFIIRLCYKANICCKKLKERSNKLATPCCEIETVEYSTLDVKISRSARSHARNGKIHEDRNNKVAESVYIHNEDAERMTNIYLTNKQRDISHNGDTGDGVSTGDAAPDVAETAVDKDTLQTENTNGLYVNVATLPADSADNGALSQCVIDLQKNDVNTEIKMHQMHNTVHSKDAVATQLHDAGVSALVEKETDVNKQKVAADAAQLNSVSVSTQKLQEVISCDLQLTDSTGYLAPADIKPLSADAKGSTAEVPSSSDHVKTLSADVEASSTTMKLPVEPYGSLYDGVNDYHYTGLALPQ